MDTVLLFVAVSFIIIGYNINKILNKKDVNLQNVEEINNYQRLTNIMIILQVLGYIGLIGYFLILIFN